MRLADRARQTETSSSLGEEGEGGGHASLTEGLEQEDGFHSCRRDNGNEISESFIECRGLL